MLSLKTLSCLKTVLRQVFFSVLVLGLDHLDVLVLVLKVAVLVLKVDVLLTSLSHRLLLKKFVNFMG